MRPKMYSILTAAIEHGIEFGWDRGHKHSDTPNELHVKTMIEQEIWNAIEEVFDFEDES